MNEFSNVTFWHSFQDLSQVKGFRWGKILSLFLVGMFFLIQPGCGPRQIPPPDQAIQWKVLEPQQQDMNEALLEQAFRRASNMSLTTSLLIARNDKLIGEAYFRGHSADEAVNIKSASKSVIATLVGIAMEEGHIKSLNTPLREFLPQLFEQVEDPRKKKITLRDALLMRTGLRSTSSERYGRWVSSGNWLQFALNQPLIAKPGTKTSYSTGDSHLVAAALSNAVGRDLMDYANEKLFHPMGVEIHAWDRDPQGYRLGGNNLRLTPRALLKFGQLYLNKGSYKGKQLVQKSWIKWVSTPYVNDTESGYWYGYYWWIYDYYGTRIQFAWGYGGQYLFLIRRYDLAVVTTSIPLQVENRPENHLEQLHSLVTDYILPAVDRPPWWHSLPML